MSEKIVTLNEEAIKGQLKEYYWRITHGEFILVMAIKYEDASVETSSFEQFGQFSVRSRDKDDRNSYAF